MSRKYPAILLLLVILGCREVSSQTQDYYDAQSTKKKTEYLRHLADRGMTNCNVWTKYEVTNNVCGYSTWFGIEVLDTNVSDITPLQGLEFHLVNISGTQVSDLTPLVGMPLRRFRGNHSRVSDLSLVKDVPCLVIDESLVSDLTPLAGRKIEILSMGGTAVTNLEPLRTTSITGLLLNDTGVSSLEALKGKPMDALAISETKVTDLTPLKGMPLTFLVFTPRNITNGIDIVRTMKSLEKIGTNRTCTMPAAEFWKKYDAGEFNKSAEHGAAPLPSAAQTGPS
jgi:Leucine-rich repeat (LRR) protein